MNKGKQNTMFSMGNTLDIAGDVDFRPWVFLSLCGEGTRGMQGSGTRCHVPSTYWNHSAKATFQKFNELPDWTYTSCWSYLVDFGIIGFNHVKSNNVQYCLAKMCLNVVDSQYFPLSPSGKMSACLDFFPPGHQKEIEALSLEQDNITQARGAMILSMHNFISRRCCFLKIHNWEYTENILDIFSI